MDTTIRRRIAGSAAFNSYCHAESLYIQDQGMEPADLWQLLAFLQTMHAAREVQEVLHRLALRYQPTLGRRK